MSRDRALQRNAADPQQVRYAERKVRRRGEQFEGALRAVMQTPAGRLVMWELLRRLKVFESIWDPSARIHYNAGRQDAGHELLAELVRVDEQAYLLMESEARSADRREAQEAAAVQTPAAAEGDKTDG